MTRPATTRSAGEVVEDLRGAFASGDPERVAAVLHPDFHIEQPASFPHGGVHHGPAGMADMGRRFARHWKRTIGEPTRWEDGDTVVQMTTQTWTSLATGRAATVDVVEVITVEDDRIRSIRVFQQDSHLLLATLDT